MRKTVFLIVFVILAVLIGGLYWFHFVAKPGIMQTAMASMPRPVAGVAVEAARAETWTPRLAVIGTFKAVPGIDVSGQVGGDRRGDRFEERPGRAERARCWSRIDDSTEQADLKSNVAMLKNAMVAYQRQQSLTAAASAPAANFDRPGGARQAAGAVDRGAQR